MVGTVTAYHRRKRTTALGSVHPRLWAARNMAAVPGRAGPCLEFGGPHGARRLAVLQRHLDAATQPIDPQNPFRRALEFEQRRLACLSSSTNMPVGIIGDAASHNVASEQGSSWSSVGVGAVGQALR